MQTASAAQEVGAADAGPVRGPRSGRRRPALAVLTGLAVLPMVLAACSNSSSSSSTTGAPASSTPASSTPTTVGSTTNTTMPPLPPAAPSPGCAATPAPPGTVTLTPTIDGKRRLAIVHVPTGYHATTPVPLVVNMHGSQSTARAQEALSGMDTTADAYTFIVAYPQGLIAAGTGFEWNVPGQPLLGGAAVPAGSADDVKFITQLVTLLGPEVLHRHQPGVRHRLLRRGPDGQPAGL